MAIKVSVKAKAYQCSLDIRRLCTNRFVEGYIKGYARAKKDIKERII